MKISFDIGLNPPGCLDKILCFQGVNKKRADTSVSVRPPIFQTLNRDINRRLPEMESQQHCYTGTD